MTKILEEYLLVWIRESRVNTLKIVWLMVLFHVEYCECIEVVSTPILCFYTRSSNYDLE